MEAITLVWLWLALPATLPGVGEPCPVHVEDLGMFPAPHVATRERDAAWLRYQYVKKRYAEAELHCLPNAEHWRAMEAEAHHAWEVWGDLRACYHWKTGVPDPDARWVRDKLERIRRRVGHQAFYHGQLPGPVDVTREPVEVVPLP